MTLLVASDSLSEISSARILCLVWSSDRLGVARVEQYPIALLCSYRPLGVFTAQIKLAVSHCHVCMYAILCCFVIVFQ